MVWRADDALDLDGNPEPGTLRYALSYAPAGSKVVFQPGLSDTITLTHGELQIDKDLTIAGPGAGMFAVSGGQHSRVFNVESTVVMSGLTIKDGNSSGGDGGGVYNTGDLEIDYCTIRNNMTTGDGGGIYNDQGTLKTNFSTISSNTADGAGGGIANRGSGYNNATINSCTFSGNSALLGGGIFNFGGHSDYSRLLIVNSTFNDNQAAQDGGAIDNDDGDATINNSTISGNRGFPAGISVRSGDVLLNNTIVSDNYNFVAEGGVVVKNEEDVLGTLDNESFANLLGTIYPEASKDLIRNNLIGVNDPKLGPLADNGGADTDQPAPARQPGHRRRIR
jgi:hypothetical protein